MILKLTASKLFTEHPDQRFSYVYDVPKGTWTEMWRRHTLLGYTMQDMADFFHVKTGQETTPQNMKRWVFRTKVYMRAHEAMKLGARAVASEYFGDLEAEVIEELLKNIHKTKSKTARVLV
jgi:hypothetical protein